MAGPSKELLFVITIDTEIDKSLDWTVSSEESFRSVTEGIPEKLTSMFRRYDARPTYLLSGEVMEDPESVAVLRSLEECELGTHLHGDVVEPCRRFRELKNNHISEMQCTYTRDIEFQKLETLTDLFIEKFGRRPLSFRAGRWGAGNNTIGCLQDLGYRVDSSVSPGIFWRNLEGQADFLKAYDQPYFPSLERIDEKGKSSVLEVPASVLCSDVRRRMLRSERVRRNREIMMMMNRMLPTLWLAPVSVDAVRMNYVIDRITNRRSSGPVVVNLTFHSIDIIPGASPAARNEAESRRILRRMEDVIRRARSRGFLFVTLSRLYGYFNNGRSA